MRELLISAADRGVSISAFAAILTLPVLVVRWYKYTRSASSPQALGRRLPMPAGTVLAFLVPICVSQGLADYMTAFGRIEVLSILSSQRLGGIAINGKEKKERDNFLVALRSLGAGQYVHTHPTDTITVAVESERGTLRLFLRRDSGRPRTYWVFYPRYRTTQLKEIGMITTEAFDRF